MTAWMRSMIVCGGLLPGAAFAQQIDIQLRAPTIHFAAPPRLVVVEPGIQVVEDYDDEVFFVDGWYWQRTDARWFRTRDHAGGWVVVDAPRVPPGLIHMAPGHYRHFKAVKVERRVREMRGKHHEKFEKAARKVGRERGHHGGGHNRGH